MRKLRNIRLETDLRYRSLRLAGLVRSALNVGQKHSRTVAEKL